MGKFSRTSRSPATSLNDTFTSIMAQRATLVGKRAEIDKPAKEASDTLALYVSEKLPGLSSTSLDSLRRSMKDFDERIIQINVNPPGASLNNLGGAGLVDRCQSCHVGTDPRYVPPQITLTKADLGMAKSTDAPFTSHPDIDLLKWHPLEKFGCSPCHGGNGRAIDSVQRGHGRYEHWLWPLYYRENFEAGCQQCHAGDMVTEHAPVLNEGKQLYRAKGCIGCHRFNGFDNQDEQLVSARQRIMAIEKTKGDDEQEIPRLQKLGDNAPDNAAAEKFYGQATNLTVEISRMDAERETLEGRSHNLIQEIKKVGPDLKEARQKLHKEWIPYWIAHTTEFRPDYEDAAIPVCRWRRGSNLRVHLAECAHRSCARPSAAGEFCARQTASRIPRLSRLSFCRRRIEFRRRHVRCESEPRGREGQLRLSRSLGAQPAPADASLLLRMRSAILAPKITRSTTCLLSSTSSTRAARMTITNSSCSSRR